MRGTFAPRLDMLPTAQYRLWSELAASASLGFILYGGTAVALRLGHRSSADFDFFSERSLDREAIRVAFPFIARSTVLQDRPDTLTLLIPGDDPKGLRPRANCSVLPFSRASP